MKRADGTKLRHTDPLYRVAAHFMTRRSDALNAITLYIPLAPINAYLREKSREKRPVSHMAVILGSYLRTIAEFPALNRFVVNKEVYARNEVAFGMVVLGSKKNDSSANDGTFSKMFLNPADDIFTVERKIEEYVEKNRTAENGTEDLIDKLLSIPGLLRLGCNLIRFGDKHGLLPKKLIDASPFHCSMVFTNLASIRTNHIHHHCYDFGTVSMLMAAGNTVEVPHTRRGEIVLEKCIPLGCVMDERICSGSYFGKAFHRMRQFLADPTLLELPAENVMPDPEI